MASKAKEEQVTIRPIEIRKVRLTLVGDTPIVEHAWSEKAKRMMLEQQMGVAKGKKKDPKNPVDDFIRSMYWLTPMPEDGRMESFEEAVENGAKFGVPVTAIKQAAISAAFRMGFSKDKVSIQGAFFIEANEGELVEIESDRPIMREDMVRVGMGTADIRYRGEFRNWRIPITMQYNVNGQYSIDNIVNMINYGGFTVGIMEMRPEKGGRNGMFHVDPESVEILEPEQA